MSSPRPQAFQGLRRLSWSSPNFHDQLSNVLCGEEYQRCVQNLQGDDSVWLVDYLDKVCRHVTLPRSSFKSLQALDGLDPSSPVSRKCLRELRNICSTRMALPTSYQIPSNLLKIDPEPFAFGGFGDVYHATLDGSRVCIKRLRMYTSDGPQKGTKVRYSRRRSPHLPSPTKPTELLSRGRNVEAHDTPKHSPTSRCYHRSPPARFELDAWRGSAGIY